MSFHPSLANDTSGPMGIGSLSGAGLPGGSVSNGPNAQSVAGLLAGTGMQSAFDQMHTGRHTSSVDPIANPRGTVNTQYFLDLANMNPDADIGNMEPTWMDVESGPVGIIGQNKPMVAKSLTAMNRMLKSEEFREKYGEEKDSRWFNKRFSFAGILRHDASNKGREAANAGNVCQLFVTGFRVRCVDIWQSYECRRNEAGPEIGDLLQVILRRYPYVCELRRARGEKNCTLGHYWALIPYYSKDNTDAPVHAYKNYADGSCGEAYRIGRVAAIYGSPSNIVAARGIARKYVWAPTIDGGYKTELLKLRHLEIEVAMT